MGCSWSSHHKVMDSTPKLGHPIEFLENAHSLVKHFDEIKSVQKSKKLVKCIFIFGKLPSLNFYFKTNSWIYKLFHPLPFRNE